MSTIIYIIIAVIVIAIVMFCVFVLPTSSIREKKEEPTQPDHFDLLDDNGDPIKSPKVKTVIGGGDSNAPVQELQYFCIKYKGYHVSVWPKDQPIGGYIEFNIAGISHREGIDNHLGEFIANLVPEPTNPYDANAIKILAPDGHHLGYVPKDTTDAIRDISTLPCSCYCYIGENNNTYFSDCYIEIK